MNNFSGSKRAWKNPNASLTISNVLVTRDTTYRTGLRDNNRGFRNFQRAVLTGHVQSTLNEPSFENQYVSTTNVVGCYVWERAGGRQSRSLSFLSFFSCYERPLQAGYEDLSFATQLTLSKVLLKNFWYRMSTDFSHSWLNPYKYAKRFSALRKRST